MNVKSALLRAGIMLAASGGGLVFAASAFAHAELSPSVALAKHLQLFSLAVPTEKENATTAKVELTPPNGFSIDSFVPAVGWKRETQTTGTGENTTVQKVTWTGGKVPTEEDALFQFLASADSSKTYTFKVRQTYSDGTVVDWSGPESSDTPAPIVEAKSSLGGGGGGSDTLAIIAIALGALALVIALAGLLGRSGGRALT
jgi:uncharacterized protein YcnI